MKLWEFESSRDRDDTVVVLLSFLTFWMVILHFHDDLSGDAVIGIVTYAAGWISAIVMFYFKDKNGKNVSAPTGESK